MQPDSVGGTTDRTGRLLGIADRPGGVASEPHGTGARFRASYPSTRVEEGADDDTLRGNAGLAWGNPGEHDGTRDPA